MRERINRYRNDSAQQGWTSTMWFGAGALAGAGIALLLAPKSGREIRQDIADGTTYAVDRTREAAINAGHQAQALAQKATGRHPKKQKRTLFVR